MEQPKRDIIEEELIKLSRESTDKVPQIVPINGLQQLKELEEKGKGIEGVEFLKKLTGGELNFPRALQDKIDNPPESTIENNEAVRREAEKYARRVVLEMPAAGLQERIRDLGVNPKEAKRDALEKMRLEKGLGATNSPKKKCISMAGNGQIKQISIVISTDENNAINIIKSGTPSASSCSRLSVGPLLGHTIYIWRNPDHKGKNKRLSKILGFPAGGEALIIMEDQDLTVEAFLVVEKIVVS